MAKTEGTQNIPSALLEKYKATLGEADPKSLVGKRKPWRLPPMQTAKGHPTKKQKAQRAAFLEKVDAFGDLDSGERQRWYENEPEWNSYLWYYNYFLMSALNDTIVVNGGVVGVIKSMQHKTITMPSGTGEGQVALDTVDIDKTIVMLQGGSVGVEDTGNYGYAGPSMPYVSSLATNLLKCKWSISNVGGNTVQSGTISAIIIEYI